MSFSAEIIRRFHSVKPLTEGNPPHTIDDLSKQTQELWKNCHVKANQLVAHVEKVKFAADDQPDNLDLQLLKLKIAQILNDRATTDTNPFRKSITQSALSIYAVSETVKSQIETTINQNPQYAQCIQTDEGVKDDYLRHINGLAETLIDLFPNNNQFPQPDKLMHELALPLHNLRLVRNGL